MSCLLVADQERFGVSLGIWQHIEKLLMIDRSGSALIHEIIRNRGEKRELKLGQAELILTGC
jgi:hypothetical protein